MENNLKCSIIISVYKDTDSLDLILESLIKLGNTVKNIHVDKVFTKVKFTGNERSNCMFCKFKGGIEKGKALPV